MATVMVNRLRALHVQDARDEFPHLCSQVLSCEDQVVAAPPPLCDGTGGSGAQPRAKPRSDVDGALSPGSIAGTHDDALAYGDYYPDGDANESERGLFEDVYQRFERQLRHSVGRQFLHLGIC